MGTKRMNISHSTMDLFFAYNREVGNVSSLEKAITKFADYAQNGQTPEMRERYAQAVKDIKEHHLPKARNQLDSLGKSLKLEDGKLGQPLSLEELEETKKDKTRLSYSHSGDIQSYLDDPSGEYVSTKS